MPDPVTLNSAEKAPFHFPVRCLVLKHEMEGEKVHNLEQLICSMRCGAKIQPYPVHAFQC